MAEPRACGADSDVVLGVNGAQVAEHAVNSAELSLLLGAHQGLDDLVLVLLRVQGGLPLLHPSPGVLHLGAQLLVLPLQGLRAVHGLLQAGLPGLEVARKLAELTLLHLLGLQGLVDPLLGLGDPLLGSLLLLLDQRELGLRDLNVRLHLLLLVLPRRELEVDLLQLFPVAAQRVLVRV